MTPSAIDANANTQQRLEYPAEEWRMVRQLVRLIGSAKTWQDMVEASDALFHVEMRAKCMRDERNAEKDHISSAQGLAAGKSWLG